MKALLVLAVPLLGIGGAVGATTAAPATEPASPDAGANVPLSEALLLLPERPDEPPPSATAVADLDESARDHSVRLGLRPPEPMTLGQTSHRLALLHSKLRSVVDFLDRRREVRSPTDQRATPPPLRRGSSLSARIARQHRRATRLALGLGLDRPGVLRIARDREARTRQLARWRSIAEWLADATERPRSDERALRERFPHYEELMCVAQHESGRGWDTSTGNGYYGGLQMDRLFQQTYGPRLYRTKGTADNWTAEEQLAVAERAVEARGFSPWPTTARACGLL
jgi:hypothetical protein